MVDLKAEIASTLQWMADAYDAGEADVQLAIDDDAVRVIFRKREAPPESRPEPAAAPRKDGPPACAGCGWDKPMLDVLDGEKMCLRCGAVY